jgi:mannose-1-phosphate guanylyltransferase/mannose-6-phosphate isomerase
MEAIIKKNTLKDLLVTEKSSIKDCLIKFNNNKRSFVIVTDRNKVLGVVTEGDIRRKIILGESITNLIEYNVNFRHIKKDDSFDSVCKLFKLEDVDFLPILNKSNELVDVITKKQFHVTLLHEQNWNASQYFIDIDESSLDYEIYNRPWGFYKTVWLCPESQVKVITIFPNEEISLQSHKLREEHWIIVKGNGIVSLNENEILVESGSYIHIPKESKHQIKNCSKNNIVFCEVQLGEYFGEDDIKRFYDKYNRV